MNSTFCTPKKLNAPLAPSAASFLFVDQQHHHQTSYASSNSSCSNGSSFRTPGSVKRTNRFHMLPMMNRTPISRLNRVIVNPFEASLTERLHLPMICSPSLFHRPATPQMSSTQFEWTIEDVASLGPANVEADETQFVMTTDPEIEARAQEAITSYFRDNIILPSPITCPLREASEKIRLLPDDIDSLDRRGSLEDLELLNNKGGKKIKTRDGICQTILTFPPNLPKHVEDLLAGFCTYTQDQQQEVANDELNDSSNASLRRKLFETSLNSDDLNSKEDPEEIERQLQRDREEQRRRLKDVMPIGTPELKLAVKTRTRHFGSPSDNLLELSETKKESFGSLSPILSSSSGSTPAQATPAEDMHRQHSSSTSSLYRSTPERLSSIQRSLSNSVEMSSVQGSAMKVGNLTIAENQDKENSEDSIEDDMQMSEWSCSDVTVNRSIMFMSSQSHQADDDLQRTPVRRQNKSASRKNLSRSFSQILNEEFGDDEEKENLSPQEAMGMLPLVHAELLGCGREEDDDVFTGGAIVQDKKRLFVRTRSAYGHSDSMYRTDSGFTDDDLTSTSVPSVGQPSFSTPSKKLFPVSMVTSEDVSMRSFRCD